jgi:hypothetical protein
MQPYLGQVINFGGEWMLRGDVIDVMLREGHEPRFIDRWLQGQECAEKLKGQSAETYPTAE